MRRLLKAMVIPAAAILIATLFAPSQGAEATAANEVAQGAQVQTNPKTPFTPHPLDWLERSATLVAQLAPSVNTD
ncbi:MAG: hypothetical protein O3A53_06360 [Acidobacteria bacterium]|nr:hypothetical protein [Acidobacteriota bacterium]